MSLDPRQAPDFFGTDEEITRLTGRIAETPMRVGERLESLLTLAWFQRQRDSRAAVRHADAAAALIDTVDPALRPWAAGRLALVRAEAAWLFGEMARADALLDEARVACTAGKDFVGLGDVHLLHSSLLDQAGIDHGGVLRAAGAAYRRAGDTLRAHVSDTWIACIEATAQPDQAEARWGPALHEAAALKHPGLDTYVEGCQGTLAWERGDPGAAISCFQRGFDAALRCGQLRSAVTLAQNIGIAFSSLNDHEGALDWVDRARALVQPTGWPYATGWCLMQTGSVLVGLGRAQAAKELLLEGMPVLAHFGASRNHALACQILGEATLELHQDEEALRWCEAACAAAAQLAFPDLLSGSLRYLAQALSRLGRAQEAVQAAERGLAIAHEQHDLRRVATIQHALAEIARRHTLPAPPGSSAASGAIHHLEAALATGAQMPGFVAPPEWHAELSADFEAAGDGPRALASERLASQAHLQAHTRRAESLTTALLVRHQTEQAWAEASRQRAQAETSRLHAELLETQAALEKERTQSLLVHAGKMVAIGRLASGVVHEMSHPVGTLLLLAEALQDRLAAEPYEVTSTLATLVGESRRLQQFTGRLRDFARAEPTQLAPHDLRSVLADARQLFAPRLAMERIDYAEQVSPTLVVRVDPQRLALALANLVFNAADAMAGSTRRQIHIHADAARGEIGLHVDDNGSGLPDAVRARLFEPFFTTKPEGKGLGLGLALSAESLAAMGGRIVASNRPEGGARFSIVLPAV